MKQSRYCPSRPVKLIRLQVFKAEVTGWRRLSLNYGFSLQSKCFDWFNSISKKTFFPRHWSEMCLICWIRACAGGPCLESNQDYFWVAILELIRLIRLTWIKGFVVVFISTKTAAWLCVNPPSPQKIKNNQCSDFPCLLPCLLSHVLCKCGATALEKSGPFVQEGLYKKAVYFSWKISKIVEKYMISLYWFRCYIINWYPVWPLH